MTLPTMAGGIDQGLLCAWCQAVDEGPFHALAVGERIGFDNLEMHTTLTFAAAATERVRLASTLTILPMYATAWAAKSLATLDVVSGGRLDLVVGVGGRRHDYDRAERSFAGRHQRLDDQVAELRRIWAGGDVDGVPVGPAPVQSGGPPVFASAMGPKSTARAARWARPCGRSKHASGATRRGAPSAARRRRARRGAVARVDVAHARAARIPRR